MEKDAVIQTMVELTSAPSATKPIKATEKGPCRNMDRRSFLGSLAGAITAADPERPALDTTPKTGRLPLLRGVRTLTDEELQTLSTEIEESCLHWSGDDECWTDDDAETRYYDLQREIRRRWEERNPEEAAYYRMEQKARLDRWKS